MARALARPILPGVEAQALARLVLGVVPAPWHNASCLASEHRRSHAGPDGAEAPCARARRRAQPTLTSIEKLQQQVVVLCISQHAVLPEKLCQKDALNTDAAAQELL